MKYIAYLIMPLLLISLYGGCNNGDGGNNADQVTLDNLCFLLTSDDPCFDPNEGSETRTVDDKNVEEVIAEEESKPNFVRQLEFSKILSTLGHSIFLPPLREGCSWGDDGLVIKTSNDWDNYRNNCFFTDNLFGLEPRDVDFSENMVVVSLKGFGSFGTQIVAVLEFENELLAVISDTLSNAPSPQAKSFGSFGVEVERKNLPVSFIRVEDICNSIYNLSNSECLAESIINECEAIICSSDTYDVAGVPSRCDVIDCSSFHCEEVRSLVPTEDPLFFMSVTEPGSFTDLGLNEKDFPIGIVEVGGVQEEFGCSILIE